MLSSLLGLDSIFSLLGCDSTWHSEWTKRTSCRQAPDPLVTVTGRVELSLFEPVGDLLLRWDMPKARGMLGDREACTLGQFGPQVALHLSNDKGVEVFVIKLMLHVSAWRRAQAVNRIYVTLCCLTIAFFGSEQYSTWSCFFILFFFVFWSPLSIWRFHKDLGSSTFHAIEEGLCCTCCCCVSSGCCHRPLLVLTLESESRCLYALACGHLVNDCRLFVRNL